MLILCKMENEPPIHPAPSGPNQNWINLILPIALILGLVLLLNLNSGSASPVAPSTPLEDYLKITAGYIAVGAEIAAGLVIGVGVLIGIVNYVRHFFQASTPQVDATELIRLRLGRILALGLEFTVASDILRTAVAPTRQDILNLGAIVLLRTLLNYFLEHEIQQAENKRAK
jgi:uncharacterized membrane protein